MNLTSQAAGLLPDRTFCRLVAFAHVRFEPELKPLVRACDPSGVSVDVGAWFGPWTYWLSRRVDKVVAFEANPAVAKVLQAGVLDNVEVHNIGVSDHSGVASLAVSGHGLGQEGRSSIDHSDAGAEHIDVELTTLDAMDLQDVRFLKVDVEGYDLTVLRGAKAMLSRWHPVVVAELEQRYCDVGEAISYMSDLGYGAYVLLDGSWLSLDEFDLVADQQAKLTELPPHGFLRTAMFASGNYVNNVVFVHPESTWTPWSGIDRTGGSRAISSAGSNGSGGSVVPPPPRLKRDMSTETRQATRRALRQAKYLIGDYPVLLPVLLRATPEGTSREINDETKLVVEGFPRSGNTFAVFAFRDAQGPGVRVVGHVHHPAQVKLAVRRGLPTLLVIRRPLPCLASYLVTAPHGRPAGVLKEYIRYHRALLPYLDSIVVGDFERVTDHYSELIDEINDKFGTDFAPFDQTPENVERVFKAIGAYHAEAHPGKDVERVVPRPSLDRAEENRLYLEALQAPELAGLLAEAEEIYRQCARLRAPRPPRSPGRVLDRVALGRGDGQALTGLEEALEVGQDPWPSLARHAGRGAVVVEVVVHDGQLDHGFELLRARRSPSTRRSAVSFRISSSSKPWAAASSGVYVCHV